MEKFLSYLDNKTPKSNKQNISASLLEAPVCRCSSKLLFLKVAQYLPENTYDGVNFNKILVIQACKFIKKRIQQRCFPVNIAKF